MSQILLFAMRIQLLKKAIGRIEEEPPLSRCRRSLSFSAEMPCPNVLPKSIIAVSFFQVIVQNQSFILSTSFY